MRILPVVLTPLLLCQCTYFRPGRADGIDPNPFSVLEQQARPENHDPKRITIPMLRSATLEKRWGKPKLLVGPKGGYALRYSDPKNDSTFLTIFGSPELFSTAGPIPPPYTDLGMDERKKTFTPVEVSQMWQSTRIADRSVRFHITEGASGDQPFQFSTETFRLTGPDGRSASYRLRTASANDAVKVTELFETADF